MITNADFTLLFAFMCKVLVSIVDKTSKELHAVACLVLHKPLQLGKLQPYPMIKIMRKPYHEMNNTPCSASLP